MRIDLSCESIVFGLYQYKVDYDQTINNWFMKTDEEQMKYQFSILMILLDVYSRTDEECVFWSEKCVEEDRFVFVDWYNWRVKIQKSKLRCNWIFFGTKANDV